MIMTTELRSDLIDGVNREGWDDDEKSRLVDAINAVPIGSDVPMPTPDEEYLDGWADRNDIPYYDTMYPVWTLTEYFYG